MKKILLTTTLLLPSMITTTYVPYVPPMKDLVCMATNLYREARGEPLQGQVAVAQVVLNRAEKWNKTVCEIIYQKNQFSWTNVYKDVKYTLNEMNIVIEAYSAPRVKAMFYHANYVKPYWRKRLQREMTIGNHTFYYEL